MADEATSGNNVRALLRDRLRAAIGTAGGALAGPVVLLGDPAVTEAVWDDVLDRPPAPWHRMWRPRTAGELLAGMRDVAPVAPGTVVRLDDLRRFLLPPGDVALGADVAGALRTALRPGAGTAVLVAAALPADPRVWQLLTQAPASGGHDRYGQARALLRHAVVMTTFEGKLPAAPPALVGAELELPVARAVRRVVAPVAPSLSPAAPDVAAPDVAAPVARAVRRATEPVGPGHARAVPVGPVALVDVVTAHPFVEPEPGAEPSQPSEVIFPRAPGVAPQPTVAPEPAPTVAPEPASESAPERLPEPAWTPPLIQVRERRPRPSATSKPACTRWRPQAQPSAGFAGAPSTVTDPAVLRERGEALEAAGNRAGADRYYEAAAHRGDVVALARLAALRNFHEIPSEQADPEADRMFEAAAAERNTAVLFGLAAAGHGRALHLLARLRQDVAPTPRDHASR